MEQHCDEVSGLNGPEIPEERIDTTRDFRDNDRKYRSYRGRKKRTALPDNDGSDDGLGDHVRLTTHTVKHVLTACLLTATLRQEVLLNWGLPSIFGSEAGGYALCLFLHLSQLLRPLPPRPDPP